jgi:hypothetical protein
MPEVAGGLAEPRTRSPRIREKLENIGPRWRLSENPRLTADIGDVRRDADAHRGQR